MSSIRYYELRAQIHAKHLSRETLESQLATAMIVIENRNKRDREKAQNDPARA